MANNITQVFEEAGQDAQSLQEFVNNPANLPVNRRLAPPIKPLSHYEQYMDALASGKDATITSVTAKSGAAGTEASVKVGGTPSARTFEFTIPKGENAENIYQIRRSYQTYEMMVADKANIPANTSIDVTNDEDYSENGTYTYDGTSFTKSIHDTQKVLKKAVEDIKEDASIAFGDAIQDYGYVTIDSFELGATITQRNQALRHAADGKLFRWAGDLPKVVPASSTPASSGGISANAWLEVSDATLRQELTNPNGAYFIKDLSVNIKSIKDLMTSFKSSRHTYEVRGYHAELPLGGGTFVWDAATPKSNHDGGYVIDPDRVYPSNFKTNTAQISQWFAKNVVAGTGCFVRQLKNNAVNIHEFGAWGDRVTDDSYAIQAASNYTDSIGWSIANTDTGAYGYSGAGMLLTANTRTYILGKQIDLNNLFMNVDFNNALFMPSSTFNPTTYAFNCTIWNSTVERMYLAKFKLGFKLYNANLDSGVIQLNNIHASNVEKLYTFDTRSSFVKITDFKYDNVCIVSETLNCDRLMFKDGWLSAGVMKNKNDAHFILNSMHSPELILDRLFYVPRVQTALNTSIVKMMNGSCRVVIDGGLFGGEPGQLPLVNNFCDAVNNARGTHILIKNTLMTTTYSGSNNTNMTPVVLFALPNSVVFDNCNGYDAETHQNGIIAFDPAIKTLAQAEIDSDGLFRFETIGNTPENYKGFPLSQKGLLKYDVSRNKIKRIIVEAGVADKVIIKAAGYAFHAAFLKISIYSIANAGTDKYSEYIATSTLTAAQPNDKWQVLAINQGSSPASAVLTTDVAGNIVLSAKESVGKIAYMCVIESLAHFDGY